MLLYINRKAFLILIIMNELMMEKSHWAYYFLTLASDMVSYADLLHLRVRCEDSGELESLLVFDRTIWFASHPASTRPFVIQATSRQGAPSISNSFPFNSIHIPNTM